MPTSLAPPTRSRAHLTAADLRLTRGGRPVLTGVDLTVSAGDRLGVVGENGRGKTTLLQALAARLTADSGSIRRSGSVGVADQEMPIGDDRSVGDLIDVELAEVRAALGSFDAATTALAAGRPAPRRATPPRGVRPGRRDADAVPDAFDAVLSTPTSTTYFTTVMAGGQAGAGRA